MQLKTLVPSFLLFVLGVGGMVGCDWVAARYFSPSAVAQWLVIKSIVLVIGAMITLGFERGFLRRPECSSRILKFSLLNIAVLTPVVFIILSIFYPVLSLAIWIALSSAGLAVLITLSELKRASLKMVVAQAALNGWKVALLLLFIAKAGLGLEVGIGQLAAIAILGVVSFFVGSVKAGLCGESVDVGYRDLLVDARLFALFNVLLVTSSYADQFIVGSMKDGAVARLYLAHATLFLAPMLLIAAFFGFQLAPHVRESRMASRMKPANILWASLSVLVVGIASVVVFGASVMKLFYGNSVSFDLPIAAIMVAIGVFRIMYAIPSAVLGVLGSITDLRRFFLINAGLFALQMLLTLALIQISISPAMAVLLPCLLHWAGKSIQGVYQSNTVLRA